MALARRTELQLSALEVEKSHHITLFHAHANQSVSCVLAQLRYYGVIPI